MRRNRLLDPLFWLQIATICFGPPFVFGASMSMINSSVPPLFVGMFVAGSAALGAAVLIVMEDGQR